MDDDGQEELVNGLSYAVQKSELAKLINDLDGSASDDVLVDFVNCIHIGMRSSKTIQKMR